MEMKGIIDPNTIYGVTVLLWGANIYKCTLSTSHTHKIFYPFLSNSYAVCKKRLNSKWLFQIKAFLYFGALKQPSVFPFRELSGLVFLILQCAVWDLYYNYLYELIAYYECSFYYNHFKITWMITSDDVALFWRVSI